MPAQAKIFARYHLRKNKTKQNKKTLSMMLHACYPSNSRKPKIGRSLSRPA
jgi:hypothetical protein